MQEATRWQSQGTGRQGGGAGERTGEEGEEGRAEKKEEQEGVYNRGWGQGGGGEEGLGAARARTKEAQAVHSLGHAHRYCEVQGYFSNFLSSPLGCLV